MSLEKNLDQLPAALRSSVDSVLAQLREASDLGRAMKDRAVELPCLLFKGGSAPALRWLMKAGCLQHFKLAPHGRAARAHAGAPFSPRSRFALTERGLMLADSAGSLPARAVRKRSAPRTKNKPRWNAELRELRLGPQLVKRYRRPATNQALILDALEELGWPPCIDDPLPGGPGQRKRLLNAIQRLNGAQVTPRMRFHSNGAGNGVLWEVVRLTKPR